MSSDLVIYEGRTLTRKEQLAHIFGEVASGRSLDAVLREDAGMPLPRDFWLWHMEDQDIRDNLARARENGVEALLDRAQDVAENPIDAEELVEEIGPKGIMRRRTVKEALGHRRLIIETYIKRAQMIQPRKYGAKLDLTSDGEKLSSIADAIAEGNRRIEESRK
jgi:hypothetical protein